MPLFILLVHFLFILSVNAQEVIHVTADRIKSSIEDSPSDIEVFDQEDIENAFSITDLLKRSSDISVSQSGPAGGNTSLFLRGSDSSHVLVVLDGIILNDVGNPNRQFDFSKLTLNNIERIEILKGSQGLLYGSNAIGGVILLTSKKLLDNTPKNTQFSSQVNFGSNKTINPSFDLQKLWADTGTGISLGVEHLKSDGFSAANDNQVKADRDGVERTNFNFNLDQRLSSQNSMTLHFKQLQEQSDLDKKGGSGGDDPNYYQTTKQQFFNVELKHLWASGETKLNISQSDIKRSVLDEPDVAHPTIIKTFNRGILKVVGLNHTHDFSNQFTINSNVDYQHESDQQKHSNNNLSFFNYARIESGKHVLNLGGRLDKNQYFKDYFTYKTAYMFSFEKTSLKLTLSSGFRSPSLNQLFDPTYGNKNLSPEKSRSSEVGINHAFSKLTHGEMVVFKTDIKNRLSYDPGTFVNKNFGNAKIYGVENNLKTALNSNFSTQISATWLRAIDLQTKLKLARRPRFNFRLTLNYVADRSTLSIDALHTGSRHDDVANTVQMKRYTIFNLGQNFKWSDHYSSYVKLNNLFNNKYEEVFGYGTGGRLVTVGFKYIY